ncbi:helix-turn-helix domain-containing protein [Brevibacterium linens]|uniref:Helix-turn-helix n=1 Tax=Brevibacterium linens TaxID=1703 RepID=A0A2H1KHE1_BRELN|nr:helix-turn-helix transcriptional regulator [Brevibacterium linens]SMX99195.1 Helix-turn-helix [Brevibacterium linens]
MRGIAVERSPEGSFAARLREERRRRGLSQAEVAERLSARLEVTIDKSALARMERGERSIRLNEAVALAEILQVTLLRLVGESGDGPNARVRRALDELENAEVLLRAATEEVERRGAQVEEARARLAEVENRELAEDLRAEQ